MLPTNVGVNYFVDWDDFRAHFRKEFFPLHKEVVATNTLEGTAYFQGDRSVDDYLDEFRDLISTSGYTSLKTIVVKFRRGLDTKIGDAVATMAAGRPDDLDTEGWFEAAVRIDQAHATNAAFRASIQLATAIPEVEPELPLPVKIAEKPKAVPIPSPPPSDILDIKGMSADDIRELRQRLFGVLEKPSAKPADVRQMPLPMAPETSAALPTSSANRFQRLPVEELPEVTSALPVFTEAIHEKPPRRPQWERRLLKQPTIGTTEIGPLSLHLRVEVESTSNQRKYGVRALVDSGATGLFIDREYVKSNQIPTTKLSVVVPVFNVDGTANTAGSISEVAELILRYNGHSEQALFSVTGLGKQHMILGHTWLKEHNPEVNWQTGKVEMSRCSLRCCNGCRNEAREERKLAKKEAADISACRTGPFPTSEPAEGTSDSEPQTSDIPFDIEEGDCVWATGLLPEVEYVRATSTISQRLAESFTKSTNPHPTLPTGGSGLKNPVPDYVKMFSQVFSEEGFAQLPNRKLWDHAIELTPGAQPKGCKVYPLSVTEQGELDRFLTENLETGRIRQNPLWPLPCSS